MENKNDFYARSFSYENFMRRAFRSERNFSKGIDNSVYHQLEYIEKGYALSNKNYPKQIQKIKAYLLKGIDKVLKWKLTEIERFQVYGYEKAIRETEDEYVLYNSIRGLLDATQRFRDS